MKVQQWKKYSILRLSKPVIVMIANHPWKIVSADENDTDIVQIIIWLINAGAYWTTASEIGGRVLQKRN